MAENPDRYDYNKAQVSNRLTVELLIFIMLKIQGDHSHTCATQGPRTANSRDRIQKDGEEKGSEGIKKTARKRAEGGEEETGVGGRGKEEVCVSHRS